MPAIRLLPALLVIVLATPGAAQSPRHEAANMRLLGHHDLQSRSAYQPVIHRHGDRSSRMSDITAAPGRIHSPDATSSTARRSST
jgi:hypothetical protein